MIRQRKDIKRSPLKPRKNWLKSSRFAKSSRTVKKSGTVNKSAEKSVRIRPKKKRTAAEERAKFAREFGSKARADFVAALPSVASGHGPCVNAHVVKGNGGMGYKAGYLAIAPLTDDEHTRELHQHGPKWFEAKYDISLEECAANTERLWQAHLAAVEAHS